MTAKEKAQELVNEFRKYSSGEDEHYMFSPAIEKENGKKCALIALEKVLEYCNKLGVYNYKHQKELLQLKKEIEKL